MTQICRSIGRLVQETDWVGQDSMEFGEGQIQAWAECGLGEQFFH